jgi:hypothetical protein
VDSGVVVWVREFLVHRTQRVRVGRQLSKDVKVTSGVPQGSVLGPKLFLVCVNDIWRNTDWSIGLLADDCIIYKKITKKICRRLWTPGEWAVENGIKINPVKGKQ